MDEKEETTDHFMGDDENTLNNSNNDLSDDGELEIVVESSPQPKRRTTQQQTLDETDKRIIECVEKQIEDTLDEKAAKTNLTAQNVKNILKHVVTNKDVLALVRHVENPEENEPVTMYEPKYTRATAKTLLSSSTSPHPNVLPWAKPPVDHKSETHVLMEKDLEEDEEDSSGDEYIPHSPATTRTGGCTETEPEISPIKSVPSQSVDADLQNCTVSSQEEQDVGEHDKENEQANIALRTRSKLSLSETPLEKLEQAFIPPDITTDMYEMDCEDDDVWADFLKAFTRPLDEVAKVGVVEDEEQDPEYNILADEEIDKVDKEELRADRAVTVSRKEVNALMAELFEYSDLCDLSKPQNNPDLTSDDILDSLPPPPSPAPVPNTEDSPAVITGGCENNPLLGSVLSLADLNDESGPDIQIKQCQIPLLAQQLRQHVQMLTHNIMLMQNHPELGESAEKLKECLFEMKKASEEQPVSVYHLVYNLKPAVDLIDHWEKTLRSLSQESVDYRVHVFKVIAESLIAIFLDILKPVLRPEGWSANKRHRLTLAQCCNYIQKYLMPHVPVKGIEMHIYKQRLPSKEDNPIKYYFKHRQSPNITHYVAPVSPGSIVPLINQSPEQLPYLWQQYVYKTYPHLKPPEENVAGVPIIIVPAVNIIPVEEGKDSVEEIKISFETTTKSPTPNYSKTTTPNYSKTTTPSRKLPFLRPKGPLPPEHFSPRRRKPRTKKPKISPLSKNGSGVVGNTNSKKLTNSTAKNVDCNARVIRILIPKLRVTESQAPDSTTKELPVVINTPEVRTESTSVDTMMPDMPSLGLTPLKNNVQVVSTTTDPTETTSDVPSIGLIPVGANMEEGPSTVVANNPIQTDNEPDFESQSSGELAAVENEVIPVEILDFDSLRNTETVETTELTGGSSQEDPNQLDEARSETATKRPVERQLTFENIKNYDGHFYKFEGTSAGDKECNEDNQEATVTRLARKEPSGAEKKRLKIRREFVQNLAMATPDSPEVENQKTNDFAASYLDKARTTLEPDEWKTLLEILSTYDEEKGQFREFYDAIEAILSPKYPDLSEEFLLFLTDIQAQGVGKLMPYLMIKDMNIFINKLQVYFKDQPAQIKKILKCFADLSENPDVKMDDIKSQVLPLLKGNAALSDWFLQSFACERPPKILSDGPSEIMDITKELARQPGEEICETIVVPDVEDPYGGPNCICNCHTGDSPQYQSRNNHCNRCGLKFLQGKMYISTGKGLRPAVVSFITNPEKDHTKRLSATQRKRPDNSPNKQTTTSPNKDGHHHPHDDSRHTDTDDECDAAGGGKKKTKRKSKKIKDHCGDKSQISSVGTNSGAKPKIPANKIGGKSPAVTDSPTSSVTLTPTKSKKRKRPTRKRTSSSCSSTGSQTVKKIGTPMNDVELDSEEHSRLESTPNQRIRTSSEGEEPAPLSLENPAETNATTETSCVVNASGLKIGSDPSDGESESEFFESPLDITNTTEDSDEGSLSQTDVRPVQQPQWTRHEDKVILQTFQQQSEKDETFYLISQLLPYRSAAEIKNRFEKLLKLLRQMSSGQIS